MNKGVAGKLTVCLLDFNRPQESERCLRSIHRHFTSPRDQWRVLYLSNGGQQDYARRWYDEGLIDTHLLNARNWGCGIAAKQMAQAALTDWVMMVQTDQYAIRDFTEQETDYAIAYLVEHPDVLYIDLAGNQGQGRASERAHLINRRRYLDLSGLDDVIGGPGPFAQHLWTERHLQDQGLPFATAPLLFADNGAYSEREYGPEYGNAKTRHRTDTRRLWVLSPFSKRAEGFPNLVLSDDEWTEILENRWPAEGKIPEHDKPHSFVAWPEDIEAR